MAFSNLRGNCNARVTFTQHAATQKAACCKRSTLTESMGLCCNTVSLQRVRKLSLKVCFLCRDLRMYPVQCLRERTGAPRLTLVLFTFLLIFVPRGFGHVATSCDNLVLHVRTLPGQHSSRSLVHHASFSTYLCACSHRWPHTSSCSVLVMPFVLCASVSRVSACARN
jgi:hypothetical protein